MTRRLLRAAWHYRPLRQAVDSYRFMRAAARWAGWGRKGDPRNSRAELTRAEWRRGGYPPEPWTVDA